MSQSDNNPSYFNRIGYQAGLLAGICCLVSVMIIIGNKETKSKIEEALRQDQLNMLEQVLPSSLYNNDLLSEVKHIAELKNYSISDILYIAKYDNNIVGYAFIVAKDGYSGKIKLIMGIDSKGTILGVRVISHSETPGLGDKIELYRDDWITSFDKLSLANTPREQWAVKKDGGQFDQFTGATITPRTVVQAVLGGLDFFSSYIEQQSSIEPADTDKVNTDKPPSMPKSDNNEVLNKAIKDASIKVKPETTTTIKGDTDE